MTSRWVVTGIVIALAAGALVWSNARRAEAEHAAAVENTANTAASEMGASDKRLDAALVPGTTAIGMLYIYGEPTPHDADQIRTLRAAFDDDIKARDALLAASKELAQTSPQSVKDVAASLDKIEEGQLWRRHMRDLLDALAKALDEHAGQDRIEHLRGEITTASLLNR